MSRSALGGDLDMLLISKQAYVLYTFSNILFYNKLRNKKLRAYHIMRLSFAYISSKSKHNNAYKPYACN